MKNFIFLIIAILFLPLCSYNYPDKDWVEETMSSMTLREKIAQMIISYSDGYNPGENSREFNRLKKLIKQEKIGGIIFFKGNSVQQAELTNKLQSLSEVPLLISADYERGTGMRLNDGSLFPNNMAIGASRRFDLAYEMGLLISEECRALGVHQNYAPVMDINNNPDNPIINVRSFGEDAQLVSEMGISIIKGLQDGGVIATAKHFPGHGDTDIDSHSDLPVLNFSMNRLRNLELIPFKSAIDSGVKSVMTAHLSFPELEKRKYVPASLSDKIVKNILINELDFKGLIVTDALNMAGVTKHLSPKEVAILAVEAGVDLILMPQGESVTINAIFDAVSEGKISEDRINLSVQKILEAKKWLNLDENKYVDENKLSTVINNEAEKLLSQEIADASVTLVKNDNNILPINDNTDYTIISINNTQETAGEEYFTELMKNNNQLKINQIIYVKQEQKTINVLNKIQNGECCIIPVYSRVRIKTGTVGIPDSQIELINSLINRGNGVVVISFGNPYLLKAFQNVEGYICAYGDAEASVYAVYKAILGNIDFNGKLPVTINETFKFGFGLSYK
ncbi:MAG: glycoside hydrolase family 3 C-terminal domain-containing protein [Ignavibacteria bacterium]|nr:glycoside hydrolase family 3 C-terminal domain-containing protein [Ignavibacteria bacterium]